MSFVQCQFPIFDHFIKAFVLKPRLRISQAIHLRCDVLDVDIDKAAAFITRVSGACDGNGGSVEYRLHRHFPHKKRISQPKTKIQTNTIVNVKYLISEMAILAN